MGCQERRPYNQAFSKCLLYSVIGKNSWKNAEVDAVSRGNTIPGTAIDIKTRRLRIKNSKEVLPSVSAIKPLVVRMVYETSKAVKIPLSAWAE